MSKGFLVKLLALIQVAALIWSFILVNVFPCDLEALFKSSHAAHHLLANSDNKVGASTDPCPCGSSKKPSDFSTDQKAAHSDACSCICHFRVILLNPATPLNTSLDLDHSFFIDSKLPPGIRVKIDRPPRLA